MTEINLELKPWQKDFIEKTKIAVITPRQIGFTFLSIIKVLKLATENSGRTILYASPYNANLAYQFSVEFCKHFQESGVKIRRSSKTQIEFDNNSIIIFNKYNVSGIRGYSFNDVFLGDIDSHIKREVISEFLYSFDFLFPSCSNVWIWTTKKYLSDNLIDDINYKNFEKLSLPFWVDTPLYDKYKELRSLIGLEYTLQELNIKNFDITNLVKNG